jgi:hypothetical protein
MCASSMFGRRRGRLRVWEKRTPLHAFYVRLRCRVSNKLAHLRGEDVLRSIKLRGGLKAKTACEKEPRGRARHAGAIVWEHSTVNKRCPPRLHIPSLSFSPTG